LLLIGLTALGLEPGNRIVTGFRSTWPNIGCVGHVEIHFHLLPGVDDGPSAVEESIALAEAAVADGTDTVVVTPHVNAQYVADPLEVPGRARELAEQLWRERVPLAVVPGGEIAHELACGSVLQLTAGSFVRIFSDRVRADAMRILKLAPHVAIASDAHGASRMPALRAALRVLEESGVREPLRFADAVPRKLLEQGLAIRRAKAAA
jgi:tyrosine-protein phosphatase YwqE